MKDRESRIVVVCALREELAAIKRGLGKDSSHFEVLQAGIGAQRAANVATQLSERTTAPRVVISTGFCGGLSEGLQVGEVVVGSKIVRAGPPELNSGQELAQKIYDALSRAGLRVCQGRMLCSETAVATSTKKRSLGKEFSAHAVDMESYALAENLPRETRVIFVRAVSDTVDDELPPGVCEFLDENGRPRLKKITGFIFRKPGNVKTLIGLGKRASIAAKALGAAWKELREFDWAR